MMLTELFLFILINEYDSSPTLLELYNMLGDKRFLQFLEAHPGETIELPLASDFRKLMQSYDIYTEYIKLISDLDDKKDVEKYKAVIDTIAKSTGFTQEEIIDIIGKVSHYINEYRKLLKGK